MRKKVVSIVLACALTASVLTGCGESGTEKESKKTEATAKTDKAKGEEEKSAKMDYASWTGKEWNAASDEEKMEAAKFCLAETTKMATEGAGVEWTDDMEKTALTDEEIEANKVVLEASFTQDETIKMSDIIEQAAAVAESMIDQVDQIQQ